MNKTAYAAGLNEALQFKSAEVGCSTDLETALIRATDLRDSTGVIRARLEGLLTRLTGPFPTNADCAELKKAQDGRLHLLNGGLNDAGANLAAINDLLNRLEVVL